MNDQVAQQRTKKVSRVISSELKHRSIACMSQQWRCYLEDSMARHVYRLGTYSLGDEGHRRQRRTQRLAGLRSSHHQKLGQSSLFDSN